MQEERGNNVPVLLHHGFGPIYDENSDILILGSFPSVKSREQNFYYGHPQNRFWKVIAAVKRTDVPVTVQEKAEFLHRNHIALYDVVESCVIIGSSDASIRDVTVTDLRPILACGNIGNKIFTNGGKAYDLYMKYTYPALGISATRLPSTSPANAAFSLEKLIEQWTDIINSVF